MKGDPHPAAVRLCAALPVRTHERPSQSEQRKDKANNTRAVIVEGVLYESLTDAARRLNRCREAIRKRIYKGTARYA